MLMKTNALKFSYTVFHFTVTRDISNVKDSYISKLDFKYDISNVNENKCPQIFVYSFPFHSN